MKFALLGTKVAEFPLSRNGMCWAENKKLSFAPESIKCDRSCTREGVLENVNHYIVV